MCLGANRTIDFKISLWCLNRLWRSIIQNGHCLHFCRHGCFQTVALGLSQSIAGVTIGAKVLVTCVTRTCFRSGLHVGGEVVNGGRYLSLILAEMEKKIYIYLNNPK